MAFQATLARHPEHALSLAVWRLWMQLGTMSYAQSCTTLSATRATPQSSVTDVAKGPAAQALTEIRHRLAAKIKAPSGDFTRCDGKAIFDAIHALSLADKLDMLAYLTAITVKVPLAEHGSTRDDIVERIGAEIDCRVEDFWRPSGGEFFGRVARQPLMDTLTCIPGKGLQAVAGMKKAQASDLLDRWFSDPAVIPASDFGTDEAGRVIDADTASRIAMWLPAGMSFGGGDAGTEEEAGGEPGVCDTLDPASEPPYQHAA